MKKKEIKKIQIAFVITLITLLALSVIFIVPIFERFKSDQDKARNTELDTSLDSLLNSSLNTSFEADSPDDIARDSGKIGLAEQGELTRGSIDSGGDMATKTTETANPVIKYTSIETRIQGEVFILEIANTVPLRNLGLSNRSNLAKNKGLLFMFDVDGYHSFWMKDMNFDIDILWLDKENKIVHIERSVSPSTYPNSFQSPVLSRYVLELRGGTVDRLKIKIGDMINF